jgi:hypothetical protein
LDGGERELEFEFELRLHRPKAITMPVFVPLGVGIVAKREHSGSHVILMWPSSRPGVAISTRSGEDGEAESVALETLSKLTSTSVQIANEQKFNALTSKE